MQHRSLVLAAALALAAAAPAAAQTTPRPAPAATPVAFSAHAHADVSVTTTTATYALTMQIAVAQRDRFTRYDILSIRSTSLPIPSPALTFVLDRVANAVTIWNDATKTYAAQPLVPSPAGLPGRVPASAFPPNARSPLADLDIFSFTVALANHTVTAGLPTTGLTMTVDLKQKGESSTAHLTATAQLADEFAAFPVAIDARVDPGMHAFDGRFTYLVDDFAPHVPAETSFSVPTGYVRADSLLAVLLGRPAGSTR
jgi:hypothetical protein